MVRYRVLISGLVQGVNFRTACQRMAWQCGVAGWVRNRFDGTVEGVFEGDPEAVESLVRFCREGPRGAEVLRVDIEDEVPEGLVGFEIR